MLTNEIEQFKLTKVLLKIYLVILTWIILFKMQLNIMFLINMNFRSINLIPFAASSIVNGKIDISEIVLNMIAFIPFGVYLSMLKPEWNFIQKVLPIFGLSFMYESLQYIFAIGGSDITDLLGNTFGGIIGIGLFVILRRLLEKRQFRF